MEQPNFREEEEIDLLELIKAIWAQRVKIIKYGVIAGVIGIIVAISIPNQYISSAIVMPEMDNSSNNSSIGSLASLAGINLNSESVGITATTYPQIITSAPFIFEFANIPVVLEDGREVTLVEYFSQEQKSPWWSVILRAPMQLRKVFSRGEDEEGDINVIDLKRLTKDQEIYKQTFSERVLFELDEQTLLGNLTVETQSPEVSLMLADSILVKLQEYITLYKTSKIRSELESNESMLREAQAKYYRADSIYAATADRTKNITSNLALANLDRLNNEKTLTYNIYNQIAGNVEYNKTKLNAETPILTVIEPATFANRASSPKKTIIVIVFGFLGGIVAVFPIILQVLLGKKEESEESIENK